MTPERLREMASELREGNLIFSRGRIPRRGGALIPPGPFMRILMRHFARTADQLDRRADRMEQK